MVINATRLYQLAVRLSQGIATHIADTFPGQSEALTSIIYASLSAETFINEMALQAQQICTSEGWSQPTVQVFADTLEQLEESKAQITTKFLIGKFVLSGKPFDKGRNPFQNFARLVKLRNEIVHQKAQEDIHWDDEGNPYFKKRGILQLFQGMGLLGDLTSQPDFESDTVLITNWLDEISTRAMARWACVAASGMVNAMIDAVPDGSFHNYLEVAYRPSFSASGSPETFTP